ncbi:hypothetical protein DPMN_127206 [Dreissena polymorpha]|uniref:Uncharacterized protein n=1 Tax=Dreissena polymorpha TaxID=45954 RepID=A0A9D4GX88_DREPO|nr:hypothetical protein DPMN_127206 [Dreissena polymorpha]
MKREKESDTEKKRRQIIDKALHAETRHPKSIDKANKQFLKEIQKSPEYRCTVCHIMMY